MKIIAHRCGLDRFPPLTVSAAEHSLAAGAYAAELDLRTLADGTVVVNHDTDVRRLFGSDAQVVDLTAEQWAELRYTDDPARPAHTFADFLTAGIGPLLLHVKLGAVDVRTLLDVLAEQGALDRVVLGFMSPDQVRLTKNTHPATQVLAFLPALTQVDEFIDAGADIIRLWEPWVAPELVQRIAHRGCRTWVMTGQPGSGAIGATELSNLAVWDGWGVDGVLVDLVEPAVDALNP